VWTPCIMHRCVISTMLGSCFWFFKKTFIFQTIVGPPPCCLGPSHFQFSFLPHRPSSPVLRISHSDFLPPSTPLAWSFPFLTPVFYHRWPPQSVLPISHSSSLTCDAPRSILHISHSGSLTRRSLWPVLHISHSGSLTRRSPPAGPSHFPLWAIP
jgi:hypothetical protein